MTNDFRTVATRLVSLATVFGLGTAAQAGSLIDFESVAGASDNLNLSGMQFATDFGYVTFGIDNDGDGLADSGKSAFLEAVGDDNKSGFVTDTRGTKDLDIDPDNNLDNYFLRTEGLGGNGGALLITYGDGEGGGLTAAAQGEIWDIDGNRGQGTEQWLVEAFDGDYNVIDSILSPVGTKNNADSLDGQAWTWAFERLENDIKAIRISFAGTKDARYVGLAFDNFSADRVTGSADDTSTEIPEPASVLGLLAIGGVLVNKRRQDRNA